MSGSGPSLWHSGPVTGPFHRGRAAIVVMAVLIAACSGGSEGSSVASSSTSAPDTPTTRKQSPPAGAITLAASDPVTESLGAPAELPEEIRSEVLELTQAYVDAATVAPLLDEPTGADLQELFDDAVAPRVAPSGRDRLALTDEAVPPAVEDLETESVDVQVSGLADGLGDWVMVAASLDYHVTTEVAGGPLEINRFGDLYFTRGADNAWKITAYDIGVVRTTDEDTTADRASA